MYPCHPHDKKALALHCVKGTVEYLSPEFGIGIINVVDEDHVRDSRDRHSIVPSLHLLNGLIVAWKCKKQSVSTLRSTGCEIISLATGIMKTGHIRYFATSIGYPFMDATITLEDNQCTINTVKSSCLHENTHHLDTRISWISEQYTMGIIKLLYTKKSLNSPIATQNLFPVVIFSPP
jgi:hypothetical protein